MTTTCAPSSCQPLCNDQRGGAIERGSGLFGEGVRGRRTCPLELVTVPDSHNERKLWLASAARVRFRSQRAACACRPRTTRLAWRECYRNVGNSCRSGWWIVHHFSWGAGEAWLVAPAAEGYAVMRQWKREVPLSDGTAAVRKAVAAMRLTAIE